MHCCMEENLLAGTSDQTRVGAELRRIRQRAGLSGVAVGTALGWSQSKLSRVETGRFGISLTDLSELLNYYDVPEEVRAELLTAIAGGSPVGGAWIVRAGGTPRRQREVAAVESRVTRMRQYHPVLVPGQLQSFDYARSVAAGSSVDDPEGVAAERLRRQQLLVEDGAPAYEAVLDERALSRWPGPAKVLRDQVEHLIARSDLPTVSIKVLPVGGEAAVIAHSPFLIYHFRTQSSPPTVLIETRTADLYLSAETDVDVYTDLFEQLAAESLNPAESRDYLRALAKRVPRARSTASTKR